MSVGNLWSKLPTDTFPFVLQSVTTNENFPSVVTDWITDGKVSELKKKRRVADVEVLVGYFFRRIQNDSPYSDVTGSPFKLPTASPRDLKWQIRTVTCRSFHQNHQRNHRRSFRRWNRNICQLCRPSPPLFLLFLPNPNSPHLQTTSPPSPPPNKNLPHISTTSYISWSFMVTVSVFWFTDGFYQFL